MTNTSQEVSVFTKYLPEGKDPVALGFTNNKPKPSPDQQRLIYLAEKSRAHVRAASVPPNNQ